MGEAGVICELVSDGEEMIGVAERKASGMMRRDACLKFGRRWGLKVCTIEDLVEHVERIEGICTERSIDEPCKLRLI